jgi:Mrp family chromosome partitioning ATPase
VLPRLDWTDWPTRVLFFTSKGGVGKKTVAAAAALALADRGREGRVGDARSLAGTRGHVLPGDEMV